MKRTQWKRWLMAVGVMAMISGCESGGGNSLIGTWLSTCIVSAGGSSQGTTIFKSDNTCEGIAKIYSDDSCTLDETTLADRNGTYSIGGSTTGSDGSDATKLDTIWKIDGADKSVFTMYRFKSNGHLLIARDADAEHDGTSDAKRANDFDSALELTRQ